MGQLGSKILGRFCSCGGFVVVVVAREIGVM